jgi:hypothetical protein
MHAGCEVGPRPVLQLAVAVLYRYLHCTVKGTCAVQIRESPPVVKAALAPEPHPLAAIFLTAKWPTRNRRRGIFNFSKIPRKRPKKQMAVTQKV